MANRLFIPPQGSLEVNVCNLWCDVTFGAAGAVTSFSGKGFASVTQVAAHDGQYLVTLSDSYNKMLWAGMTLVNSADSDPTAVGVLARVKSEQVASSSAPQLVVQFFASDTGAEVDPASGAVLKVKLELKNSSVA